MDWSQVSDTGIVIFVILLILAGAKGLWVFGYHYRALEEDRNDWRRIAMAGAGLAERGTRVAETVMEKLREEGS